ncbi:hypothetical protein T484DRAFT_1924590, partial [Baffinella frigidus]
MRGGRSWACTPRWRPPLALRSSRATAHHPPLPGALRWRGGSPARRPTLPGPPCGAQRGRAGWMTWSRSSRS